MEVPSAFAAHLRQRLGGRGERWLQELPRLVDDLSREWAIAVGQPFALSFNFVARATLGTGEDAVLKIAPPWEDGEVHQEIFALALYDGRGACRLLESDVDRQAMLLERVRPGAMLATVAAQDDDEATTIAADVMRRLWLPAAELPDPGRFRPLAAWFKAYERHRAEYGGPGPFPPSVLDHAETVTADLLSSSPPHVLLHADFHHDNVLSSDRAGWLIIDPKGMIGDLGYEVGPFMLNPWSDVQPKPTALLRRRLDILAAELAYPRDRLRDWAIAHAVLSACWTAEDGGDGWQAAIGTAENLIGL
jgi:streptomycin 6-kinase